MWYWVDLAAEGDCLAGHKSQADDTRPKNIDLSLLALWHTRRRTPSTWQYWERNGLCNILTGRPISEKRKSDKGENATHNCAIATKRKALNWHAVFSSLLASHQGDPGSIPGRVTPEFRMWQSCRTMRLVGRSSRGSPASPSLHSGTAPYSPKSPSSALQTSVLSAVPISSLTGEDVCFEYCATQYKWKAGGDLKEPQVLTLTASANTLSKGRPQNSWRGIEHTTFRIRRRILGEARRYIWMGVGFSRGSPVPLPGVVCVSCTVMQAWMRVPAPHFKATPTPMCVLDTHVPHNAALSSPHAGCSCTRPRLPHAFAAAGLVGRVVNKRQSLHVDRFTSRDCVHINATYKRDSLTVVFFVLVTHDSQAACSKGARSHECRMNVTATHGLLLEGAGPSELSTNLVQAIHVGTDPGPFSLTPTCLCCAQPVAIIPVKETTCASLQPNQPVGMESIYINNGVQRRIETTPGHPCLDSPNYTQTVSSALREPISNHYENTQHRWRGREVWTRPRGRRWQSASVQGREQRPDERRLRKVTRASEAGGDPTSGQRVRNARSGEFLTNARLHHRGSKLDPRSDLRSTKKTVEPFEFGAELEIEMKYISNNWRFEISIRDQQPSSTNSNISERRPGFVAQCRHGWRGDARLTSARRDARTTSGSELYNNAPRTWQGAGVPARLAPWLQSRQGRA
ncbi:hypothetical protein PR048_018959 [Dryococelus australis]|uniref:Uncharacterized protein n=1 Tax=Dryococelus australis TaxID=614101 RepID=A0ABQ9H290_9NEOP|nr:hypothetical protein PR048_018959 [Dryococelus australis]